MSELRSRRRCLRLAAAVLPATLLVGCEAQLSVQDPYFAQSGARVALHGGKVRDLVTHHLARHAVRRNCLAPGSPTGPDLETAVGGKALADLCAVSPAPAPHALGGILNAYGRWLKDDIRPLPNPTETATRAGS